ncbi:MAG: hypothetical protein ACPG62_07930 [Cycloclasticus sp.]
MAKDVSSDFDSNCSRFSGVTLAHSTPSKAEVDTVLDLAKRAGAKIEKPAQEVFWAVIVVISLVLTAIYGRQPMVTAGRLTRMDV